MIRFSRLASTTFCLLTALPGAHAALDATQFDPTLNPCSDLYGFANARWLQAAAIPEDRSSWGTWGIIEERNEAILVAALDDGLKQPRAVGSARAKVLAYYASGMDTQAIEKAGLGPIRGVLARIDAVKGSEDLPAALAGLHAEGIKAGFQFNVRSDPGDSRRYLAELAQGGLGLPERDYYLRQDDRSKALRAGYASHVARIFELAGDDAATARSHADVVLDLETQLASASMTAVERRDDIKTYHRVALDDFARSAPGFAWRRYWAAMGAPAAAQVNTAQPEFLRAFARLAAGRPVAEWRIYLRWHALHALAPSLPAAFSQAHFEFYDRMLRGKKAPAKRSGEVVEVIGGHYGDEPMGQALGQIFVEKAFTPEAKARATELVRNIKEALDARLRSVAWMGDETRRRAVEKLAAMRIKIGYPDEPRDYTAARVGNHPFAENWLRAHAFEHKRLVARIGRPVDRDDWWMAPHILNAYNNVRQNEIVFPAAILQPPFFDATADDALNYGAIGVVIGHEITHGFDDQGRHFDADGNLREWWTDADARAYVLRTKRIEDQYAEFAGVDGLHVNGKLTLGENISDVGGMKMAYLALQRALRGKPRDRIDGFTPEQRFFLSHANAWRTRYRPEYERLLLQTDHHSPARYRVNGPVAHMPEFARAFSCDAATALLATPADIW